MLIIGIDPGITGAICFFEDGELKDVIDMPTMASGNKNKKQMINLPLLESLKYFLLGLNFEFLFRLKFLLRFGKDFRSFVKTQTT